MADASRYLLFVTKPTGYELAERDGDPPEPGSTIELDDVGRFEVVKVASSPLPGDSRLCVYLQPAAS